MKKRLLYPLVSLLITSCAVSKDVIGNYYKKGSDFQYSLQLNKDSTFTLTKKYFEANSTCNGKWQRLSSETILLKCSVEDLTANLTNGYMSNREQKIVIITPNKIKIENVILFRKG